MPKSSAKKYTVSFGDVQISVLSSTKQETEIAHDEASHDVPNNREEQLLRTIHKAFIKTQNKRAVRDDDFFEKEYPQSNTLEEEKKEEKAPQEPTVECELRRPLARPLHVHGLPTARVVQQLKEKETAKPTWLEKLPESIRCVIDTEASESCRNESTMIWSNTPGNDSSVRMEDFFKGSDASLNMQSMHCWNCSRSIDMSHFRQFPFMLPFRFHPVTDYFMVKGYFCCWECVRSHIISHCNSNLLHILSSFLHRIYRRTIRLRPICSRYGLVRFGGDITDEQYRSSLHPCNTERITHLLNWHDEINACVRVSPRKK